MKLRIARKICRYMGYGYPINNIQRLKTAVHIWKKAQKHFKHFKKVEITMTQEEKQLLLKDLCARLPYNVKVAFQVGNNIPDIRIFTGKDYDYLKYYHYIDDFTNCTFKPYFRPMSSMTEEEEKEYHNLCFEEEREIFEFGEWVTRVYYHDTIDSIDYLNSIHIDYRGFISKNLAIEVSEENNPYKNDF